MLLPAPTPAALRRSHLSCSDRPSNRDFTPVEVDVCPLQAEHLSAPRSGREQEEKPMMELGFVFTGKRKE